MKKNTVLITFYLFCCTCLYGQWDSLGNGIKGGKKYQPIFVVTQAVYNGNLYFGGIGYDTVGNIPDSNMATWKGTNWNASGNLKIQGFILSYIVYNGNLIVGGLIDSIGGIAAKGVAAWNGTSWLRMDSGLGPNGFEVEAMAVYNGNLYIGGVGELTLYGGYNIEMWNGAKWNAVGLGVYNKPYDSKRKTGGAIFAMDVYDGKLYVGGKFDSAGNVATNNMAAWDGSNWSAVGVGVMDSTMDAFTVYNNELYAGGYLGPWSHSLGVIYKFNGTSWSPVGTGLTGSGFNGSEVNALTVYNSVVCVAGGFDTIGGVAANHIAYWNGTNWGTFGNGIYGNVYTLGVYNSELFAGGTFKYAGNVFANNVAVWSGPVGIPVISTSNSTSILPNPNNGKFTISINNFSEKTNIEIYNVLGEMVYSAKLNSTNTQIEMGNNSAGVYLYRVLNEKSDLISEGKFIIQK